MSGRAIDDEYVPFLDERGLRVKDMRSVSVQHDDEFGEIRMIVQVHVFVVPAVLNEERELFIGRKPIQIYGEQTEPPSHNDDYRWTDDYIMLFYDAKIKV